MTEAPRRICAVCIYDSRMPGIRFDESGVCSFCQMIADLKRDYGTGTPAGEEKLRAIVDEIKRAGQGKKYDVIVGVSGGTDSSFMLMKAVEWGLRPLAVHYDNTWNTAVATENIRKMLSKLKVDLYTHVVDNREADDIIRSFFKASVPDLDGPTDLALAETLYRAASAHGVGYVLEGHSFITEGISPLGAIYFDGKYIASIQKRFGTMPIRTYPNMPLHTFLKWILFKRIRKIRPFWYMQYDKEAAKEILKREFGWSDYGGHHLENRITAFYHSYYLPRKFGIDLRSNTIAARVRAGKISREEGIREYAEPPYLEEGLVEYFQKRVGLTEKEFQAAMDAPKKTYREYPSYKRTFERMAPLFLLLAKRNLVPMSFYLKYCARERPT
ncbi:MAG: N-acetyl sugar amidotransferase [Bdellovibrionales bacterium]|nr:N-acetyl sugar amidotransferase [Bdellovibrionales bacterium]